MPATVEIPTPFVGLTLTLDAIRDSDGNLSVDDAATTPDGDDAATYTYSNASATGLHKLLLYEGLTLRHRSWAVLATSGTVKSYDSPEAALLAQGIASDGTVNANLIQILGTALTETAGYLAAGFKQFFNVASPTSTMNQITLVDTTTVNTDMRGTNSAITSLSGIATATNVTDARDAVIAQGDAEWATATGFAVPGDEMDIVDAPNATAVTAIQNGLATSTAQSTAQSDLDTITGSDGAILATNQDVYHASINLSVDGANSQDEYTVVWFKNGIRQTAVTVASIQVVKRSNGTDLIASTSMTQIGSTGSYKYDATDSERTTAGEAVVAIVSATINAATRTFADVLSRDSEAA